mgnify:CR=1 FL=1
MAIEALIFDCDGVLVDTERDGHRVAFNQAFRDFGIDIDWDVALYGRLLKQVAGGKERLQQYFDKIGWPPDAGKDPLAFIARIHEHKSLVFQERVRSGKLSLRPGINRIADEAHSAGIRLGVCTTAREESVQAVLDLMGPERKSRFEHVLAGDIVSRKKPDPAVYLLASERFGIEPANCMVIEDSHIGMSAALGAGMNCVITTSRYTEDEDFTGALAVYPQLGDPPDAHVTLNDFRRLCGKGTPDTGLE